MCDQYYNYNRTIKIYKRYESVSARGIYFTRRRCMNCLVVFRSRCVTDLAAVTVVVVFCFFLINVRNTTK